MVFTQVNVSIVEMLDPGIRRLCPHLEYGCGMAQTPRDGWTA